MVLAGLLQQTAQHMDRCTLEMDVGEAQGMIICAEQDFTAGPAGLGRV